MTPNSITQVRIKNFRSLADTTVDLSPLTVLVGVNGSGKSNFVNSLHFVSDALRLGLDNVLANQDGSVSKETMVFDLWFEVEGSNYNYAFALSEGHGRKRSVGHELCRKNDRVLFERDRARWIKTPPGTYPPIQETNLALPLFAGLDEFDRAYQFLSSMSFYNFNPRDLHFVRSPTASYPLEESGENLASNLYELLNHSDYASDFRNSLWRALPHVKDVSVELLNNRLFIFVHSVNQWSAILPFESESDGAIRIIAMLAALYQQPPRALLVLEEPELYVHPEALATLCDVVKEASLRSQIIVTTHSPDLMRRFDVDALRVVERTEQGTQIGRLDETQRSAIESELFDASELLSIEGLRRAVTEH